jgi:hypothetical protein
VDEQRAVAKCGEEEAWRADVWRYCSLASFCDGSLVIVKLQKGKFARHRQHQYFVRYFTPLSVANYVASNGRIRHEQ